MNPAAGGIVVDSLRATTVEAIIGAVFEDSNLDTVESFLANLGLRMTLDDTVMFKTLPLPKNKHQTHLVCINLKYCVSPLDVWQSLQGSLSLQTSCRFPQGTGRQSEMQPTAHSFRSYLKGVKNVT